MGHIVGRHFAGLIDRLGGSQKRLGHALIAALSQPFPGCSYEHSARLEFEQLEHGFAGVDIFLVFLRTQINAKQILVGRQVIRLVALDLQQQLLGLARLAIGEQHKPLDRQSRRRCWIQRLGGVDLMQ
ncbi:hypothetical protein BL864_005471, partial [Escherichia coli]|nr:hypothetical protein [Escherichia coli]